MAVYTSTGTFNELFFPTVTPKPSPEQLQRAAVIAYNYINARLDGIYPVPFASAPGLIVDISDLLTKCYARAISLGNTPTTPKKVPRDKPGADGCGIAVVMLDDLVANRAQLPGISRLNGADGATERTGGTTFDIDDPIDHVPPRSVLDEIASERNT
jgi:hypothetical protein